VALERFHEALADVVALCTRLEWPVEPAPDDIEDQIARVADAVAPLRIPAEVAELWRQVDPWSLTRPCFPQFSTVKFDLQGHQARHLDEQMLVPPSLFPVAYSSWQFLLVELDDDDHRGGALFDWGFAGWPYRMTHRSLTEYLEQLADFYRRADFVTVTSPAGAVSRSIDYEHWIAEALDRLHRGPVEDGYQQPIPEFEPRLWPPRWVRAMGVEPEVWRVRGATAALDELAGRPEPSREIVHARFVGVPLTVEQGFRVGLDDGITQVVVAVHDLSGLFQPWNGPDMGDLYEWELDIPADSDLEIDLAPVQARFEEASRAKALTDRTAAIVERNAMVAAPDRVPTVIAFRPVTAPRRDG
jgi:hypothetical protein